jgi:hypothetical protein
MKEALKLALEALHGFIPYLPLKDKEQCEKYDKAITALRLAIDVQNMASESTYKAALAQPAQEPVAWVTKRNVIVEGLWEEEITFSEFDDGGDPVYYTPQQRRWVGLTDEQKSFDSAPCQYNHSESWAWVAGAEYAEAKLKEKNNG